MLVDGQKANGEHLLIVEDGALAADAMRIILEDAGYRVTVVDRVAAAVDVCVNDPPVIMLLDLTLPDGEGLDVLWKLDGRQSPRPARVIALTGHTEPSVAQRCRAAGCERVAVKPISMRDLVKIVRGG